MLSQKIVYMWFFCDSDTNTQLCTKLNTATSRGFALLWIWLFTAPAVTHTCHTYDSWKSGPLRGRNNLPMNGSSPIRESKTISIKCETRGLLWIGTSKTHNRPHCLVCNGMAWCCVRTYHINSFTDCLFDCNIM